jgi:hypothetical protein
VEEMHLEILPFLVGKNSALSNLLFNHFVIGSYPYSGCWMENRKIFEQSTQAAPVPPLGRDTLGFRSFSSLDEGSPLDGGPIY